MDQAQQPSDLTSRSFVAVLVMMFCFIAVYGAATAVFVVLYGGTAAVISLSVLAVLIGVAALTFSKLARGR